MAAQWVGGGGEERGAWRGWNVRLALGVPDLARGGQVGKLQQTEPVNLLVSSLRGRITEAGGRRLTSISRRLSVADTDTARRARTEATSECSATMVRWVGGLGMGSGLGERAERA